MVDILHRIAAEGATPEDAYLAVAAPKGIAQWWLHGTRGDDWLGGIVTFSADDESLQAKLVELSPPHRVDWEFIAGPDEWVGTHITFDIKADGDYAVVLMKHAGWAEPKEFMHHCSTKWGVFMLSLKQLLETGTGTPSPADPHIDNWG